MFRLCETDSYPKVPSFLRYWKLKKSMEFGKKTEEHGISQKTWFLMIFFFSKYEKTVKKHKTKAIAHKTKLCICRKSGSKSVHSIMRALVAMCSTLQWVCCIQCIVGYVYCTHVSGIQTLLLLCHMFFTCHRRSQNLKFRAPKNTDLAFWKTENWGLYPTHTHSPIFPLVSIDRNILLPG